jgi:hypothetical protein
MLTAPGPRLFPTPFLLLDLFRAFGATKYHGTTVGNTSEPNYRLNQRHRSPHLGQDLKNDAAQR